MKYWLRVNTVTGGIALGMYWFNSDNALVAGGSWLCMAIISYFVLRGVE